MATTWLRLAAGISGASAVGMGAYGAHGFKPADPFFTESYNSANKYHLVHSLLLAVAPIAGKPNVVGGLTILGITLFSGTCYTVALMQDRAYGKLAPYGGMSLMVAWLALAL